jgi:cobaltochelatase CobS
MNAHTKVSLSAEQRTALRRAIASHAQWPAYRAERNITTADLTSSLCLEVAARFDIDVSAVIASVPAKEETAGFTASASAASGAAALPIPTVAPIMMSGGANKSAALAALEALLTQEVDEERIEAIVTKKVAAALEGTALVRIEMKRADNTTWKSEGVQHPLFDKLLRVLSSIQANGLSPNVWLAGPTGSGKTHAAEQCAHAMGLDFYFNGALSEDHELLGFVDAVGHYHTTPFREAYEHGGVYLFDEVDASEDRTLLKLNAALSNGVQAFPDQKKPVKRHKDFRCIGAGNTFGEGATAEFTGRARIDAAFKSRFPVRFFWTYDVALEQSICGDVAWTKRVQAARIRAQNAGLKAIIDPRISMAGAAMIANGFTSDEAAELTYLAGLSKDQIKIVEGR